MVQKNSELPSIQLCSSYLIRKSNLAQTISQVYSGLEEFQ